MRIRYEHNWWRKEVEIELRRKKTASSKKALLTRYRKGAEEVMAEYLRTLADETNPGNRCLGQRITLTMVRETEKEISLYEELYKRVSETGN